MFLYPLEPRRRAPYYFQAAVPLCSQECPWDTPCHRNKLITHVQWLPGVPQLPNNYEHALQTQWESSWHSLDSYQVHPAPDQCIHGVEGKQPGCHFNCSLVCSGVTIAIENETSPDLLLLLSLLRDFLGIGGLGEMADHKVFCGLPQPAGGLHLCLRIHAPPEAELMAISRIWSVPADSNMLVSKPQEYTRGNMCALG